MTVPVELRSVPRPMRTVLVMYKSGVCAVRARFEEFDSNNNQIVKMNQIIGYICDGKYRPVSKKEKLVTIGAVCYKQFGGVWLCNEINRSLMDDLCRFYDLKDAMWIYCVALMRACYPGVCDCKLESRYKHSFASEIYPGVALNKNNITKMMQLLGEQYPISEKFMMDRLKCIDDDDLIIIDGCLKQGNGTDTPISKISRKSSAEGVCHHLMMYAFSSESNEPLCSKIYPGNVTDAVAVRDFIDKLEITKGIIVADRGFRTKVMQDIATEHEGLHYLVPIMKNRDIIIDSNALEFDNVIQTISGPISCTKKAAKDKNGNPLGYWFYSFFDPQMVPEMAKIYLEQHVGDLSPALFDLERIWFGTIVLQSDADLELERVSDMYSERWGIECLFKMHKTSLDLDTTNEKSNETALGSEFINFVATLMASRLRNHLSKFETCKHMSYSNALSTLNDCGKVRKGGGKWEYSVISGREMRFCIEVGAITEPNIVERFTEEPKVIHVTPGRRGRPLGSKDRKPRVRRTRAEIEASKVKN